jgi:two-component system cell cycle sensor histidine kinase/response regulator CckA
VESEPGQGSAFHVAFPRAEMPVVLDVPREVSPRGDDKRVLLVEDVDAVREVLHRVLNEAGYGVVTAANGEQALAILDAGEHVDAVVTDLVMPNMGGVKLESELRARQAQVPCLFMSGYCPDDLGPNHQDLPAPLLRKPFASSDLLHALGKLLHVAVC